MVDVTNYVLIEMGQPLHAFDLARVTEGRLIVDRAAAGEKIVTLDGHERTLDREILTIRDARAAGGRRGHGRGGSGVSVRPATSCSKARISFHRPSGARRRRWASRLSRPTDSSGGVDPENVVRTLDRAARLIAEAAGGTAVAGQVDVRAETQREPSLLRFSRLEDLLGIGVSGGETVEILGEAGIRSRPSDGGLSALVPSHRVDVAEEIDLVEEVARLKGYEAIPETIPVGRPMPPIAGTRWAFAREVRAVLAGMGFDEAVHFSFTDDVRLSPFFRRPTFAGGRPLRIRSPRTPLSSGDGVGFLAGYVAAERVQGRGPGTPLRGHDALSGEGAVVTERVVLAGLIAGSREPEGWWGRPPAADFFDVRGPWRESPR